VDRCGLELDQEPPRPIQPPPVRGTGPIYSTVETYLTGVRKVHNISVRTIHQ